MDPCAAKPQDTVPATASALPPSRQPQTSKLTKGEARRKLEALIKSRSSRHEPSSAALPASKPAVPASSAGGMRKPAPSNDKRGDVPATKAGGGSIVIDSKTATSGGGRPPRGTARPGSVNQAVLTSGAHACKSGDKHGARKVSSTGIGNGQMGRATSPSRQKKRAAEATKNL